MFSVPHHAARVKSHTTTDVSLLQHSSSSSSPSSKNITVVGRSQENKKSTATLALKDDSHQSSNLHRKSVGQQQQQQNQSVGSKLLNSTTSKNSSLAGCNSKKSMAGAGKESHKKAGSVGDKERSAPGGRIGDSASKKDGVTKVSSVRKQSSAESKKSGLTQAATKTKTELTNKAASDRVDNNSVKAASRPEKIKEAPSAGSGRAHPRTIEKASSSVSLVRKKFERKIESTEQSSTEIQQQAGKKPSQRVPKVKISQNLFLKGDANAKKKCETEVVDKERANDANNSQQPPKGHSSHNANSRSDTETVSTTDISEDSSCSNPNDPSDSTSSLVPSPDHIHDTDIANTDNTQCIIHSEYQAAADADGSPGEAAAAGPDLVIDDVSKVDMDMEETDDTEGAGLDSSNNRLAPNLHLETELPESPCYRSPLLSDSESEADQMTSSRQHVLEAFVGQSETEPCLRNKLLTNLVNKRSESDGIVCLDRPRPELSVRRCESIDNAIDLVNREDMAMADSTPTNLFPQNIKTVTPATIMKGPEDYTAGLQETVYLRTHYFGNPEPRVIWFKGGRRINQNERVKIRTYPGESTLVIRDLRPDDSGKYEIQIENEVGNDCCSASLCVEGPPEPPGGRPYITTIDVDALRLTLAWYGSTFDGGSMLTGYTIEMSSWPIITDSDQQPEPTDWTIVTSKCHSTSYKVKNLDPDREYIFRIRAQNIHGQSCPGKVSEPVSFMKFEEDFDEQEQQGAESDEEEFESPFEHRHVTLQEGSIFKENFEIYEELGRGRFGVVFKVRDIETKEVFAAKFVRCRKQEEREKCKEEISIMNGLDHRRLLQLAAAYETPREVIMIMEFIGGGELFEKVVADDFTLTEHDCVLFMRQICQAIGYMHQKDIVHLDLKPENILCKSKKSHQIKIIDFGLTRKLKPGEDVRILFGTPEFVSPEVISYEPVSAASDMWSVGVVCYVLLSGLSPFMGESDVETFANITGLNYDFDDEAFEHISEDAKDFIHKLLVKDQRRRLKALECLKHPWLDHRDTDKRSRKEINTDKLKSFLMRRRWQKAAHAIRALGRFTSLGFRHDAKDAASSIALSTQSADF